MPVPVLTVPVPPQRSLRDGYESRASVVVFGDGYEQATSPVNPVRRSVRLGWRLADAEAATLLGFLAARGGAERFQYALPGEAARLWRCRSWEAAPDAQRAGWQVVSATLDEQVA